MIILALGLKILTDGWKMTTVRKPRHGLPKKTALPINIFQQFHLGTRLKIDWKKCGTTQNTVLLLKRVVIIIIIKMMDCKINRFYTGNAV